MRASEFITEVLIDNEAGAGATPNNANVDYRGMRVLMKPSTFLALAAKLPDDENYDRLLTHIQNGNAVAAPFLEIAAPDEWRANEDYSLPAKVYGHDGRHRMLAIKHVDGDVPVEVHLFLMSQRFEWRNRHMNKDVMQALNKHIIPQGQTQVVQGPFFK